MKKQRLIWVKIQKNDEGVTPTYYFDFDLLNEFGFPDKSMFGFIREMKAMAKKEIKERSNKPPIKEIE